MCDSSPQKWSSASEVDQQLKDVRRSYQLVIVDIQLSPADYIFSSAGLTWRNLSCRAAGACSIVSAAALRAPEAFCSPLAAITLALASRAASASAAMAL